eukprot:m.45227 g.45227  ORF g.45227 m.45227 type:complete len:319 (-) comp17372_c1_seq2:105-1061(-)
MNGTLYHVGIDVCWSSAAGKTTPCVREVITTALAILTLFFVATKLFQLHTASIPERFKLIIFYLALFESIILAIHWGGDLKIQLHFVALFVSVVQFLSVSLFYGTLVFKGMRKTIFVYKYLYPAGLFATAYFIFILAYALSSIARDAHECKEPHWLLFSTSIFVLAQLFLAAGVVLTRKMAEIPTAARILKDKKRSLWSLIVVFEVSAIVQFVFDLVFLTVDHPGGCDHIFGSDTSASYTIAELCRRVVAFLCPIWVMILCLRPPYKLRPQAEPDQASDIPQNRDRPMQFYISNPQGEQQALINNDSSDDDWDNHNDH